MKNQSRLRHRQIASNYLAYYENKLTLRQWFSTGVTRNTWVQWKALWVLLPISELDWYLLINFSYGCHQIVKKLGEGASNKKG